MNLRDTILSQRTLPREAVDVPEWGCTVWVQTMTGRERDAFEAAHVENKAVNFRARIAVATVHGEDGDPLFTLDDVAGLGELSSAALDRVLEVAVRLNKLAKADVETLAKN